MSFQEISVKIKQSATFHLSQAKGLGMETKRKFRLTMDIPCSKLDGSVGQESACSEADTGLIPGSERAPGGGHGNPLSILA